MDTTIHQVLIGGQNASGTTFTAVDTPTLESLSGGVDGSSVTNGQKKTAYEKFQDAETVDVSLIMVLVTVLMLIT